VVEVHANSIRVISQSVCKLIEPLGGMGDNDSKLPEKLVETLVGDDTDLEVIGWEVGNDG
jgi:hypothetical protein